MRIYLLFLLVSSLFSATAAEWCGGVNVRDFGAKGDGVTDDTMAVQRALNFIREKNHVVLMARQPMLAGAPHLGNLPVLGSTSENTVVPELFFPSGNYRITSTLVGGTYVYLRGEEGSVITQAAENRDILYLSWGFRVQIRNLTFRNGVRHIVLWTGNEDTANFTVENCKFQNASGTVFYSYNFLNPGRTNFSNTTYGLYQVKWEGEKPILTMNNENGKHFNNSTLMTFSDCEFLDCAEIFRFNSDGARIENCKVRLSPDAKETPFRISGPATISNLSATAPRAIHGKAWFQEPHQRLTIYNSSFRVRAGEGMPLVSYAKTQASEVQDYLIFRDVAVQCGKHPLVVCEMAVPNIIDLENVKEVTGKKIRLMGGAEKITPADLEKKEMNLGVYEKVLSGKSHFREEPPYDIVLSGCDTISTEGLPDFLRKRIGKPLQKNIFESVHVPCVNLPAKEMEKRFRRTLRAVDFGVDTDDRTDDTAAMNRVLKAAAEGEATRIELPPTLILISEELSIPSEIAFFSRGLATLRQQNINQAIFHGKNQKTLWAANLRLVSGACGFRLQTDTANKAQILIDKCLFYQQLDSAISLLAGDGRAETPNKTEFLLKRSVFISPVHGIITNAAHSEVCDFWVSTNARMDRSAFLTNLGGRMRITDMLGVPMPMTDHKHNHLPFIKNWPYANDLRWIDNYGKLYAADNRFGGEYYGIPLIFNFTKQGSVAIDGAMTCFQHPYMKQCMVYYAETPQLSMIRNVGWLIRWGDAAACKYPDGHPKPEIHIRNFQFQKDSFRALTGK